MLLLGKFDEKPFDEKLTAKYESIKRYNYNDKSATIRFITNDTFGTFLILHLRRLMIRQNDY